MSCLTAEMTPKGIEMMTATKVAMKATCNDNWKRSPISKVMGLPVHMESPRSKMKNPITKSAN